MGEVEKIKSTLVDYLKDKAEFAYLFGSVLRPSFNKESDIDLGVYPVSGWSAKDNKSIDAYSIRCDQDFPIYRSET